MRLGARILASLLLISLYLPAGVAQATTGDILSITGLSNPETAGVADINVTITALLSDDTTVDTGYTGTVHFTSTDSAAVLPLDLVFNGSENGTQNFDVTFETSGSQTVTATDTVDNAITGGASTSVSAAAAFSVDLSANSTAALTSGVTRGITATVTDAFGNDVVGQPVVFAQTAGTGSVSGTGSHATDSSGVATDTVAGDQVGTVTVRGTANGHSGTVDFSVVAGPLDHVVLSPSTSTISPGGSQAYATEAYDAADNPLGDVSGTATLGITPNGSCSAPNCLASVAGAHTVTTTYLGKSDTATLTVGNNPPVAVDDTTTVLENAGSTGVDVRANDTDADSDPLTVVSVSNPPHGTASVDGDSLGVHYQPDANYSGADSFTYTITDGTDTASATVNVSVTWVNQAPTFAKGADQNVLENVGAKSVSGWATSISPGPGSGDVGQTVHFNVTGDTNPSLFSALPAISATGTLTYTPAANTAGSATISITLQDNGGTANGGIDTSTTKTFVINVATVNQAPSFTGGADDSMLEDSGARTDIGWATVISEGPGDTGQTLTFTVTTNNNALFSVMPAVNSSTGNLTYTPAANANGSAILSVTLHDSGGTANGGHDTSGTDTMNVAVTAVNDAPTFSVGSDQTVLENSGIKTVASWATGITDGPNETGQTLTFVITGNSNPSLFGVAPAVSSTGTLTFTPAANANGNATISVDLHDNGGTANGGNDTSNIQTFVIHVTHVNQVPSFTKGANASAFENGGLQSVAGWATTLSTGDDPSESGQNLNFIVSNNNNPLFSGQPLVAPDGTLTFTPAANEFGSATVSVQIHDDGGTANGGADTSAIQTFTITINFVNQTPTFTVGANQTVLEDGPAQSVPAWPSAVSSGPNDPTQILNYIVNNDTNSLFSVQPTISPSGTLAYTVAPDANGSATVSVSLHDNGGVANGGSDTSPIQTFTITVTPVNDAPTFVKGANISLTAETSPVIHTVVGWATGFVAGPSDESGQSILAYHIVTNDHPNLFNQAPAIDPSGTLTYELGANRNGVATITVDVQDNGGTANGGVDTSVTQTFTITSIGAENAPAAVNDFPVSIPPHPDNDIPLIAQGSGPVTIDPLVNDFDVDGDPLTILGFHQGAHGAVQLTADKKHVTYDPTGSYIGPDSFLYSIGDGRGGVAYATVSLSVVQDTFGPVATAAIPNIAPGYALTSSMTIQLTWSGSDQGYGVKYYQVMESRNGAPFVWLPALPLGARSVYRGILVGSSYTYRTRGVDLVGNVGAWAYTPAFTSTVVAQTSATYAGAWSSHPIAGTPTGHVMMATTRYASATFSCTCSSVSWVGPISPARGTARISVDGVSAGVFSEKSTVTASAREIFAHTWATVGVHTIIISDYNGRIDVAGFVILH